VHSRRVGQDGLRIRVSKPRRRGRRCNPPREDRPGSRQGLRRTRERRRDDRTLRRGARSRSGRQLRCGLERGTVRRLGHRRRGRRKIDERPRLAQRNRLGGARRRGRGWRRGRRRRRDGLDGGHRWLTRGRHGLGSGVRRRVGSGRRRRKRRQQELRVDVALLVAEHADAQLHVRDRMRDQAAGTDDGDGLALGHDRAFRDQEGAEVKQGDGVAVGRLDRNREAVGRDAAHEADGSRPRREHLPAERALDVDAAVLARREWIVRGEGEALQYRPRNRPRPRRGHGGCRERQEDDRGCGQCEA
jgi:hypothetical protein